MRPIKTLLFIVMAVSLAFASFSVYDYLLPGEMRNEVTFENFTYSGSDYQLVSINGTESFLLEDGEVVNDSEKITSILYTHYKSLNYPSEEELQSISDLMHEYNNSRNNGEMRKGDEEYLCRDILFITGKIDIAGEPVVCVDDESCEQAAWLVYSAYKKGVGFESVDQVKGLVKTFADASHGLDEVTDEAIENVDNINDDNIYESLTETKELIDDMEAHETAMEASIFRVPASGDDDYYRALGLCPPLELNETALDKLEEEIDAALAKAKPFSTHDDVSLSVYNQTHYRVTQRQLESEADYYSAFFKPLHKEGEELLNKSNTVLSAVSNSTIRMKVDEFEELDVKINKSIVDLDFGTMDEDLDRYEFLMENITALLPTVETVYNESTDAKDDAAAYVFILDSKPLDPASEEKLEEMKGDIKTLDAQFNSDLTHEQYAEVAVAYKELASEARGMLYDYKGGFPGVVTNKFRSFARRTNNGFADFLEFTQVMPPSEVPSNNIQAFGGFSLAAFLSLSAIAVLVFLIIASKIPVLNVKTMVLPILGLIIAIIAILVFSVFLYINLDNTANNADIEEFVIDMSGREEAIIMLNLDAAPDSVEADMKSCSAFLATSIEGNYPNMTVYQYHMSDKTCKVYYNGIEESRSESYCIENTEVISTFVFNYSAVPDTHYSAIYDSKAHLNGDEEYYESCLIATVFR